VVIPIHHVEVRRISAAGQADFTNSLGMEFVRIPAGKSWLGGGGGKPGTREVEFRDDFYLGTTEITQGQWEAVMDGSRPSYFQRGDPRTLELFEGLTDSALSQLPVEAVTWDHAQEFVKGLNEKAGDSGWVYRLPTSDEWEYAARGGPMVDQAESGFDFYLDQPTNTLTPKDANFDQSSAKRTSPVRWHTPNRLGLHGIFGNVREWCQDEVKDSSDGSARRVVRGGAWNFTANACRAGLVDSLKPGDKLNNLGFRIARVPIASDWQSLFNGKDLTGWSYTSTSFKAAEVKVEDGKPTLALKSGVYLHTPQLGDYHVRFEYKADPQATGGIHLLAGSGNRLQLTLGNLKQPALSGYGYRFRQAEFDDGRLVAVGEAIGREGMRLAAAHQVADSPWQRVDVCRFGDSFLFLINGRLAGAITNVREVTGGSERSPGRGALFFWGAASLRNIETRNINALPPEIIDLAASQALFNGVDFTGWTGKTDRWFIDDGKLKTSPTDNVSHWLSTERTFGDFSLKVRVWTSGNTGVRLSNENAYIAAEIAAGEQQGRWICGDKSYRDADVKSYRSREWNDLEVVRRGTSVELHINGQLVNAADERTLPDLARLTGPVRIGLESYGGTAGFSDIRIRED
jgi:formylglycine-generating enzyme required for sulfatase activity